MAELKRDFSGAKMNKDMDERVLPAGQYRDAYNIQVSTSDGSDVGALQTLMGNTEVTNGVVPEDYSTCVGAMVLPEKDLIYYFVAGGGFKGYRPLIRKDYIIEYDTITKTSKYIFVDIYSTQVQASQGISFSGIYYFIISDNGETLNKTGIRKGMTITGSFTNPSGGAVTNLTAADNVLVTDIIKVSNGWEIHHDYGWATGGTFIGITANEVITFSAEKVLRFNPLEKINSINHLDGMLFWTDGVNEPKKIHIDRSKKGTGGTHLVKGWDDSLPISHASNASNSQATNVNFGLNADFHTRVVVSDAFNYSMEIAMERNGYLPIWSETEHITVAKQNPKFPLKLEMLTSDINRTPDSTPGTPNPSPNLTGTQTSVAVKWVDSNDEPLAAGVSINGFNFADPVDFRVGDILMFTNDLSLNPLTWESDEAQVKAVVTSVPAGAPNNGGSTGPYNFTISAVDAFVPTITEIWLARLEDKPSLFEYKFPRFSYRWKYQDGEYSTFAPWSKVAFIPNDFDYVAKKGYNLGMTNRLRTLRLKDYFHEFALVPDDVVQVELLYKEEGKTAVYSIKEISRKDGAPEWPDRKSSNYNRGSYTLTSEMIHAVLPSNQMLRPWDNVPRSALTQEMTSNRLVYGNYKQNYDINKGLELDINFSNQWLVENQYGQEVPESSTKTIRTYTVGCVFVDDMGRESPVIVPATGSSITLDKKWSRHKNRLRATLQYPSTPPSWAKYMKYYVKETSNEYYNMAMDRWYDAEDGNVWISFPSAERNKIDEETFLILKREHDNDKAILEEARYKVIAIEPDAPMFVKTNKKSHGAAVTDIQLGSTMAGATNIIINDTASTGAWDTAFGSSWMADVYSKSGPGAMFARVTATSGTDIVASRWVDIVAIRDLGADKSIKLGEPIGDTADGSNVFASGASISYKIEIREDIVKDKPEFDGRFFVKIYKDLLLQKAIMKELDATDNMTIVKSFPLRLIIGDEVGTFPHPANSTNTTAGSTPQYHGSNYNFTNTWSGGQGHFDSSHKQGYQGGSDESQDWFSKMPTHCWYIDAVASLNMENWGSGSHRWHSGRGNGLHSSHSGGSGGSGNGGIKNYSSYSKIYFMTKGWGTDITGKRAEFKTVMTKVGTIFRFRDDPNQVAYVVIAYSGVSQGKNWRKGGGGECKSSWGSCPRTGFNINVERLDGGGPIEWAKWDPLSAYKHDGRSDGSPIDILQLEAGMGGDGSNSLSTETPAIWETEPKEDIGLDIYYEASGCLPLNVTHGDNELLIPAFSTFAIREPSGAWHVDGSGNKIYYKVMAVNSTGSDHFTNLTISPAFNAPVAGQGRYIHIERYDGSAVTVYISKATGNYASGDNVIQIQTGKSPINAATNAAQPWRAPHHQPLYLSYSNCWTFGNGIESDRIRDDFNAPQLTNGVKASTVLSEPYAEEHRSSGLIWSGIFNSTSGVNNLNQFIQAEPITKDLNPSHGTIQMLVARNTDTLAFCEDKVLRLLTDKDALYNADGSSNVTASNSVIGQATPIQGDYGISTNPESLAVTSTTIYWADQMRGQVLSLTSGTSIRSISDIGMKDYFNDELIGVYSLDGSYDDKKNEYNISIGKKTARTAYRATKTTLSYSELSKGWNSFKSFEPEAGVSLNNEYYTFKEGSMWQHHTNETANNFYGQQYFSTVTVIYNDQPANVKSFSTLNYEGTQAQISQFVTESVSNASGDSLNIGDSEYYNLTAKTGWYTESLKTNLQDALMLEYKDKEGKWFSTVKGVSTTLDNLDEREFSVQGLGNANASTTGTPSSVHKIYIQPSPSSLINNGGTNWDSTADSSNFLIILGTQLVGTSGTTIPANQFVNSTISNVAYNAGGGVYQYSGLNLDASLASVPGGVATTTGSGNETIYRFTKPSSESSWNANDLVKYVEFSNNGIADDPANTINVKVVADTFTMPASDKFILVDVDYSGSTVSQPGVIDRDACVRVTYGIDEGTVNTRASVTNSSVPNITYSSDTGFISPTTALQSDKWSGVVPEGSTTLLAHYTVTADDNYHLSPVGGNGAEVVYFVRNANAAWENYYTYTITDTYYTSTGNTNKIASSEVKVFYTPPVGVSGLDPDPMSPEGDFCSHLHDIRLNYTSVAIVSIQSKVTSLAVSSNTPQVGSMVNITSNANAAGNFSLYCVRMNSGNTAATHYYNFASEAFVAIGEGSQAQGTTVTIASARESVNNTVQLPSTASSLRYSIYAQAGTIGLDASVPSTFNLLNMDPTQMTGSSTFTPLALNYTTTSGSTTIPTSVELSTSNQMYDFTHVWTKDAERTIQASGVPTIDDVSGWNETKALGTAFPTNAGLLQLLDVTGVKVGMLVKDREYEDGNITTSRVPEDTVVTTINTTTKVIGISNNTTGAMGEGSGLYITSDWEYELVNPVINSTANNVTVTGKIKVVKYGKISPDGNIQLVASNFITTS
jgi:hypothetical protein